MGVRGCLSRWLRQGQDVRAVKLGLVLLKTLGPLKKGQACMFGLYFGASFGQACGQHSLLCVRGCPTPGQVSPASGEDNGVRDLYGQSVLCQGPDDTDISERPGA